MPSETRAWRRAIMAVAIRPDLWPTALRQGRRSAIPGWWRRWPYFPRTDRTYVRFRLETQYGAAGAPAPGDLVTYLEWCRAQDH